ncbi:MAG: beta-N-acetylhexosaminidase [Candidatus Cryptobacteroides sp.]
MTFFRKSLFILLCAVLLSACGNSGSIPVIPAPSRVSLHRGEFDFSRARFEYDSSMDEASLNYAKGFERCFRQASGISTEGENSVRFICDITLAGEAYEIASTRRSLEVRASSLNGFVYAVQTLKQLLPAAIWGGPAEEGVKWTVPAMEISDSPRFSYRGLHLDCSRHMFSVEEICSLLDLMEMHKLNRFHWHLTDDQGWRIEIRSHPRLTQVGAWREGTMVGKDFTSNDGVRYGGFYSQEELRRVVAYAAARGITIIPEIDLPGHTQAIVAAYPELGCSGGPFGVLTKWGVSDDVMCAGNEKVFALLEDVFSELIDIFPSEYIHIGGDECPKTMWKNCPKCQKRIQELGLRDDEHFTAEDYLQSYVMNRVESFLNDRGRRVIGWDEVLDGNISQSATVMSWRGAAGGIKAAQSGRNAIMTPNIFCYFDYYQSRDQENEPLAIGGYLPVNRVYSYEPYDDRMSPEECSHILGVQANIWTEYISEFKGVEYMLLPRLDALSEVQWCEPQNKDFERFRASLANMKNIYDALGVNYATHIFDRRMDEEQKALPSVTHKALGKKAVLLSEPHSSYRFHAPQELLDGKRGDKTFASGAWIGFEGEPLALAVQLKKKVSSVTIECLSDKGNYIFAPVWMKVSASEDGENYTQLGHIAFPAEGPDEADGIRSYTLSLEEPCKVKWLKVEAATIDTLPDWHPGAGAKAFLFVDEVMVN